VNEYEKTLLNDVIDGHEVAVIQVMHSAAIHPLTEGEGPFVGGLRRIRIDGQMATASDLRALLTRADRLDLAETLELPR